MANPLGDASQLFGGTGHSTDDGPDLFGGNTNKDGNSSFFDRLGTVDNKTALPLATSASVPISAKAAAASAAVTSNRPGRSLSPSHAPLPLTEDIFGGTASAGNPFDSLGAEHQSTASYSEYGHGQSHHQPLQDQHGVGHNYPATPSYAHQSHPDYTSTYGNTPGDVAQGYHIQQQQSQYENQLEQPQYLHQQPVYNEHVQQPEYEQQHYEQQYGPGNTEYGSSYNASTTGYHTDQYITTPEAYTGDTSYATYDPNVEQPAYNTNHQGQNHYLDPTQPHQGLEPVYTATDYASTQANVVNNAFGHVQNTRFGVEAIYGAHSTNAPHTPRHVYYGDSGQQTNAAIIQPINQITPGVVDQVNPLDNFTVAQSATAATFSIHPPEDLSIGNIPLPRRNTFSATMIEPHKLLSARSGNFSSQSPDTFSQFDDVPVKDTFSGLVHSTSSNRSLLTMLADVATPALNFVTANGQNNSSDDRTITHGLPPVTAAPIGSRANQEVMISSASAIEQSDLDGLDDLISQSKNDAVQQHQQSGYTMDQVAALSFPSHSTSLPLSQADTSAGQTFEQQKQPLWSSSLFGGHQDQPSTHGGCHDQTSAFNEVQATPANNQPLHDHNNYYSGPTATDPKWTLQPAPLPKRSATADFPLPHQNGSTSHQSSNLYNPGHSRGYSEDFVANSTGIAAFTGLTNAYSSSTGESHTKPGTISSTNQVLPPPPQFAPMEKINIASSRPPMPIVRSNTASQFPTSGQSKPPIAAHGQSLAFPGGQTPPPTRSRHSPLPSHYRPPSAPLLSLGGMSGVFTPNSSEAASSTFGIDANNARQRSISSPGQPKEGLYGQGNLTESIPPPAPFVDQSNNNYNSHDYSAPSNTTTMQSYGYDQQQRHQQCLPDIQRPPSTLSNVTGDSKTPTCTTFPNSTELSQHQNPSQDQAHIQSQNHNHARDRSQSLVLLPNSANIPAPYGAGSKTPPYRSQPTAQQQHMSQYNIASDIIRPLSSASNTSRSSHVGLIEVPCVKCILLIPTGSRFCSWCGSPQQLTPVQTQAVGLHSYTEYSDASHGYTTSQSTGYNTAIPNHDAYGYQYDQSNSVSTHSGYTASSIDHNNALAAATMAAIVFPPIRGPIMAYSNDSANYHPRVPLISFSATGQIVTMFPKVVTRYSSGAVTDTKNTPVVKMYPGQLSFGKLGDVLMANKSNKNDAYGFLQQIERWKMIGPLVELESKKEKESLIERRKREIGVYLTSCITDIERDVLDHSRLGTEDNEKLEQALDRKLLMQLMQKLVSSVAKRSTETRQSAENVAQNKSFPLAELMKQTIIELLVSSYKPNKQTVANSDGSETSLTHLLPLYNYLLNGERTEAAHYAIQNNLWSHALLLASRINESKWVEITSQFAQHELGTHRNERRKSYTCKATSDLRIFSQCVNAEGLSFLYHLFGGDYKLAVSEVLASSEHGQTPATQQLSNWREYLILALQNPSSVMPKAISLLGDRLRSYGRVDAAVICHLLTPLVSPVTGLDSPQVRQVLLGSPHNRFPLSFHRDIAAFQLTEIYEFILACEELGPLNNQLDSKGQLGVSGLGTKSTSPTASTTIIQSSISSDVLEQYILPYFQAYKIKYAKSLVEMGYTKEARAYVESCTLIIRWAMAANVMSPYLHGPLFAQIDELSQRLGESTATIPDESGSWFAKTIATSLGFGKLNKGSIMDVMNRGLDKFIMGEDASSSKTNSGSIGNANISAGLQRPHSTPPISPQEPVHLAQRSQTPGIMLGKRQPVPIFAPPRPQVGDNNKDHSKPDGAPAPVQGQGYGSYGYSYDYTGSSQHQQYGGGSTEHQYNGTQDSSYGANGFDGSGSIADQSNYAPKTSYGYTDTTTTQAQSGYTPYDYQPNSNPNNTDTTYPTSDNGESMDARSESKQSKTYNNEHFNDDDLGFGNSSLSKKAGNDATGLSKGTSDDGGKSQTSKNDGDHNSASGGASGGSVFGGIKSFFTFKRSASQTAGSKSVKADLGQTNQFYFDEAQKRWINKKSGPEEQMIASTSLPPPPTTPRPPSPGLNMVGQHSSPHTNSITPPLSQHTPIGRAGTPMFPSTVGKGANLSFGASGGSGTGAALGSRSLRGRSRYVDVLNPGNGTTSPGSTRDGGSPLSRTSTPATSFLPVVPMAFMNGASTTPTTESHMTEPMYPASQPQYPNQPYDGGSGQGYYNRSDDDGSGYDRGSTQQ